MALKSQLIIKKERKISEQEGNEIPVSAAYLVNLKKQKENGAQIASDNQEKKQQWDGAQGIGDSLVKGKERMNSAQLTGDSRMQEK
jgi:hypothetical protein